MLKLSTKTLAELKDSYPNLYIIGSGPTDFDYNDIKNIEDPVIFVNDMAKFASSCPSKHQYFLTHHMSKYKDVSPVTIWLYKMYFQTSEWNLLGDSRFNPVNDYIRVKVIIGDEVDDSFFDLYPWLLDKSEVVKRNTILGFFGTITSVLYMSWFVGCKTPKMIGCNPNSFTNEHDKRIGGSMVYEPDKIRSNQQKLTKLLDLSPIYF